MTEKIETIRVNIEVKLVDRDGLPIKEGSVLRHVVDGSRGVVTWIGREGAIYRPPLAAVGDLAIMLSRSTTRVTNHYKEWTHVPHYQQTYLERYSSWEYTPGCADAFRSSNEVRSEEAGDVEWRIASIIAALLPQDTDVNTDSIDDMMMALVYHLDSTAETIREIEKSEPAPVTTQPKAS